MFVCLVNCLFDHLPVCLLVCTSFSFHCLVITREPCPEPHTHTHTHTHTLPPVCTLVPVLSNSLMGYDMLTKIAPFPFLNMCTSYSVIPRTSSLCLLPTLIHSQPPSTSLCSGSRRWGGGNECVSTRTHTQRHTFPACVSVCSKNGEGILCVKDEDDLLRESDLNDVLSSPGIPACECG